MNGIDLLLYIAGIIGCLYILTYNFFKGDTNEIQHDSNLARRAGSNRI
jgi:hypothetical protein